MSTEQPRPDPIDAFVAGFEQINELLALDEIIIHLPLAKLKKIQRNQEGLKDRLSDRYRVDTVVHMLEQVRDNASLKPRLRVLRNQCVVLAVSYFASTVRDVLVGMIAHAIRTGSYTGLHDRTVQMTIAELVEPSSEDVSYRIAEVLSREKGVSFQDMKSIGRAFSDHLGVSIERNAAVNDIIVAQACRHSIVHNAGRVDEDLIRQVRNAVPRNVLHALIPGAAIETEEADVRTIGTSMVEYLLCLHK